MIRLIKTYLRHLFGYTLECKHKWKQTRAYIRECEYCGREEALFINPYPRHDEPAGTWRASPDQCMKESTEIIDKLCEPADSS